MSQCSEQSCPAQQQASPMLWVIYLLLFASFMGIMNTMVGLLAVLAVILAYVARHSLRKQADTSMAIDHTTWQIRTFWIATALCILLAVVITVMAIMIGGNEQLTAQITSIGEAMSAGSIAPLDGLKQLSAITPLRNMTIAIITVALTATIWPLTRIFKGIYALCRTISPQHVGFGGTLIAMLGGWLCWGLLFAIL